MALSATVSDVQTEVVIPLFLAHFDRAPEHEAYTYYTERFDALRESEPDIGAAERALAREIYVAGQQAGELPAEDAFANADYVNALYEHVLGRDGAEDVEGSAYWTQALDDGLSREEVALAFIASAAGSERDGAYLANRAEVAAAFALPENSGEDILADLEFDAREVLDGVTEDPATVDQALERLASDDDQGGGDGDELTLTPGADDLTGTDGDDVFNAPVVDGQQTLGSDDRIDGGEGNDTLRAQLLAGAEGDLAAPEVRGVQSLELTVDGTGEAGLDLARVQDAETVTIEAGGENSVRLENAGGVDDFTLRGEGRDVAGAGLSLTGLSGEDIDLRLQDTDSDITATLAEDADTVHVFLDNAAATLDLSAQDVPLDDLRVTWNDTVGRPDDPAAATVTIADVRELTFETTVTQGDGAYALDLTDATEGQSGLEALHLTGQGATEFAWSDQTAALQRIDAGSHDGGVTIDATAYASAAVSEEPLVIDGSDTNDVFYLSDRTTISGNGGDDTYVIVGSENVALVGIEDFETGDRMEFAIPEGGDAIEWGGDLSELDVNLDFGARDLQSVRDDLAEALGENGAGYFELDGNTYVVSTGEVGTFVNLGADVELAGASFEDNALTLA